MSLPAGVADPFPCSGKDELIIWPNGAPSDGISGPLGDPGDAPDATPTTRTSPSNPTRAASSTNFSAALEKAWQRTAAGYPANPNLRVEHRAATVHHRPPTHSHPASDRYAPTDSGSCTNPRHGPICSCQRPHEQSAAAALPALRRDIPRAWTTTRWSAAGRHSGRASDTWRRRAGSD